MVILDGFFFNLGDKKVVAGHIGQVVILCINDYIEIGLSRLDIGGFRQVVVL